MKTKVELERNYGGKNVTELNLRIAARKQDRVTEGKAVTIAR